MARSGLNSESVAKEIKETIDGLDQSAVEISEDELYQLLSEHLPKPFVPMEGPQHGATAIVVSVAIRGIRSFGPEQTLRLSQGLTIVYAGNGKGKTSLTDALELVTDGATTRLVGLPNAALEVKDSEHITHRKPSGETDEVNSPRVQVLYRDGQELRSCEWNTLGYPAPVSPDLQVLPRRRLRELVNAKRTERTEPLGAALGIADTIETWTSIAKELREHAAEMEGEEEPHLKLLSDEVPVVGNDMDWLNAVQSWELRQTAHPQIVTSSPEPEPWKALSRDLANFQGSSAVPAPLDEEFAALLDSFIALAKPDVICPACEQASVPAARIREVESLLEQAKESRARATAVHELKTRCEKLMAKESEWLNNSGLASTPSDDLPTSWTDALIELRCVLGDREQLGDTRWSQDVAAALETVKSVHARIIVQSEQHYYQPRLRAIAAVRNDATGTLNEMRYRRRQREILAPISRKASACIRTKLVELIREEFKRLEKPINEWLHILGPEGTPRVTLDPVLTSSRPSLDLRVADYPEGTSAPHVSGHFSDAQIDMLGMATHLARIERDHPGSTVVIDDPSDMLDSAARKRLAHDGIARLLDDPERPHQVVILTHDDQLVRELWEGHRDRRPATVQDTIERRRSESDDDEFSVLTSRSTAEAALRAAELISEYGELHQDRLWFRAALATHTRQAIEMCAKDISTLLGPAGLDLHSENRRSRESEDLGKVSSKIIATLRAKTDSWCDAGRHIPARRNIDEIRDLFSNTTYTSLNLGAHADVVLTELKTSKELLAKLKKVAGLLDVPSGQLRSNWVTESKLALDLRSEEQCQSCQEGPDLAS